MDPHSKRVKRLHGRKARAAGNEEGKAIVGRDDWDGGGCEGKEVEEKKNDNKCYHKLGICVPVTVLEKSRSRTDIIC